VCITIEVGNSFTTVQVISLHHLGKPTSLCLGPESGQKPHTFSLPIIVSINWPQIYSDNIHISSREKSEKATHDTKTSVCQ
jgi:hypothetical protein